MDKPFVCSFIQAFIFHSVGKGNYISEYCNLKTDKIKITYENMFLFKEKSNIIKVKNF